MLPTPSVVSSGGAVQALVLFSTALGILFLWQAGGLLPAPVFYAISAGWALFLVDSILTFVRPRVSHYLAIVLAALALAVSLPQSAHYAFIQEGAVLPATIFIAGSAAQVLLLIFAPYHILATRRSTSPGLVQG